MLTLYHSYQSRGTRALVLAHELGIREQIELKSVSISRADGSGQADASNPHPDRKVPALVHDTVLITESPAIFLYLTDMFPGAGMGPVVGDMDRGTYLTWLAYYGDVMEPVYNIMASGLDHPIFHASFRGVPEVETRLSDAFSDGRPYLLGDAFSAADILLQSPYMWFPDFAPKNDHVQTWIARVAERPSYRWAMEYESQFIPKVA